MSAGESVPAVDPVRDYAQRAYPGAGDPAAKRGCSRWLLIGGGLFLLIDAAAIGYVVLNEDALLTSGEDYSSTNRSMSMGAMIYR